MPLTKPYLRLDDAGSFSVVEQQSLEISRCCVSEVLKLPQVLSVLGNLEGRTNISFFPYQLHLSDESDEKKLSVTFTYDRRDNRISELFNAHIYLSQKTPFTGRQFKDLFNKFGTQESVSIYFFPTERITQNEQWTFHIDREVQQGKINKIVKVGVYEDLFDLLGQEQMDKYGLELIQARSQTEVYDILAKKFGISIEDIRQLISKEENKLIPWTRTTAESCIRLNQYLSVQNADSEHNNISEKRLARLYSEFLSNRGFDMGILDFSASESKRLGFTTWSQDDFRYGVSLDTGYGDYSKPMLLDAFASIVNLDLHGSNIRLSGIVPESNVDLHCWSEVKWNVVGHYLPGIH
ncbi:MAG: hypothetical protein ABIJ34_01430 [archaeon]